ncbi:MAG TPA: hypothetical protein VG826_05310 [Pirellulales bacterium]|nr:hypothetical protein [Pirellulales bacterium]
MSRPAYSFRPGRFFNFATKRTYTYDHRDDRDGAKRKAAEAQMTADELAFKNAMQSRASREVSTRELIAGKPATIETRSIREQVEQDGHATAQPLNPSANPWAGALDSARRMIARLPADRSRKAQRVKLYEAKYAEWEQARQREREHQETLARPDVVQAIDHASKRVDALQMDPTASQTEIDAARARLQSLQSTGDVTVYRADTQAADAAKLAHLREQRAQAEATLADLRQQVLSGEVKLDQLPAPAPEQPPAAPQPAATPAARLLE